MTTSSPSRGIPFAESVGERFDRLEEQ